MSTRQYFIDSATRHQIFVQRYAVGREKEAGAAIDRMIRTVTGRLAGDVTEYSEARLTALLAELQSTSNELLTQLGESTIEEAQEFAIYEAEFNRKMLSQGVDANVSVPAPAQLSSAIYTSPMKLAPNATYTIADALSKFTTKKATQIVQTIKDGVALGDTSQQISASLKQLGVLQKQQAATLTRTITNHVSTEARYITLFENQELMDGYEWVATLDSRTSLICGSRDGIVYPFLATNPRPPAHFSCRSTIVGKISPEYDLASDVTGNRPSKGASGKATLPANTTYEQWLATQPPSFQDNILGPSRGKLFREGKASLSQFVDTNGSVVNLKKLNDLDVEFNIPAAPIPTEQLVSFGENVVSTDISSIEYTQAANALTSVKTRSMMLKYAQPDTITDAGKGGLYHSGKRRIHTPRKADWERTFLHEYGHHIDYTINPEGKGLRAFSETNAAFKKAFQADRTALGLKATKTKFDAMDSIVERWVTLKTHEIGDYQIDRREWDTPKFFWLSDIIDAMTGGAFYTNKNMAGHGKAYYARRGAKEKETFANLFLAHGDPQMWQETQTLFPNLAAEFENILDKYGE